MKYTLISLQMLCIFFLSGCSTLPFNDSLFSATDADTKLYKPQSEGIDKLSKKELAAGKLPQGTFDKAPVGAFQHRNYSHVKLNPSEAVKLITLFNFIQNIPPC